MTEPKAESKAARTTKSDDTASPPADQKTPPDVIEAAVIYAVARRDLFLAKDLTRSA